MQLDERYREVFTGDFFFDPARENYPGWRNVGNAELVSWAPEVRTFPVPNAKFGQFDDVKQFLIARVLKVLMDKTHYQIDEFARGITAVDETAGVSDEVLDEVVKMSGDHEDADGWHALVHGGGEKAPNTAVTVYPQALKAGVMWVEGTAYYFDYALGRMARIEGGGIDDGDNAFVNYKYATQDAKVLQHSFKMNTKGKFKYVHELGTSTAANPKFYTIEIPYGYISEVGEVRDSMEDEFRKIEVTIRSLRKESEAAKEHGVTKFGL